MKKSLTKKQSAALLVGQTEHFLDAHPPGLGIKNLAAQCRDTRQHHEPFHFAHTLKKDESIKVKV